MERNNKKRTMNLVKLLQKNIDYIEKEKLFSKLTIELNFRAGILNNKIKVTPIKTILI